MSGGQAGEGGAGCHELRHTCSRRARCTWRAVVVVAHEHDSRESTSNHAYEQALPSRAPYRSRRRQQLAGLPAVAQRRSSGCCRKWRPLSFFSAFDFWSRSWISAQPRTVAERIFNRRGATADGCAVRGASNAPSTCTLFLPPPVRCVVHPFREWVNASARSRRA